VFNSILSLKSLGYEEFLKRYNRAKKSIHVRLHGTAASHHRLLYFQKLFEALPSAQQLHVDLAMESNECYWSAFMQKIQLFDGVTEWLTMMKNQNRKIVMVTDLTSQVQFLKIKNLNIGHLFDWIVTSEEAGCEKPHPYIFHLALTKCGLSAEEVCMIGDSYEKDVEGALNAGIPTVIWLDRSNAQSKTGLYDQIITVRQFHEVRDLDIWTN
jgi:putative hydrolase of the HAD superfamily